MRVSKNTNIHELQQDNFSEFVGHLGHTGKAHEEHGEEGMINNCLTKLNQLVSVVGFRFVPIVNATAAKPNHQFPRID